MDKYVVCVKVKEDALNEIMQRLAQAQETIYKCYNELSELGVLVIEKENTASGN